MLLGSARVLVRTIHASLRIEAPAGFDLYAMATAFFEAPPAKPPAAK
jgi:hypothetical protein